jgi:hypothetical protein
MKTEIDNRTQQAIINDQFRKNSLRDIYFTCGAQSIEDREDLIQTVRSFNDFNENNDPYQEHDFGRINWKGDKIFWKIDYYNDTLSCYEDPLSGTCRRVMTIMLADEY